MQDRPTGAITYQAARLFPGVDETVIDDGAVTIENGIITWVGLANEAPETVATVDLGDATLLPGLIDAHVHLVWNGSAAPHEVVDTETRHMTVLRAAAHARANLAAGVTTVRDVGSTDGIAIDVGRAIDQRVMEGPRVLAAGRAIVMTGGHAWFVGREVDGQDAVRQAVRAEIKSGARCIKVMASGGIYGSNEEIGAPQLTVEEMRTAVEEAHRTDRRVAAHAYGPQAIQNALAAGVDTVEHGSLLNKETGQLMLQAGCTLVPTLSVYEAMSSDDASLPHFIIRKTKQVRDASRTAYRLARTIGITIAAGTDAGSPNHPHGCLPEELRLMVEAGATPTEVLRSATAIAAQALAIDNIVGTLEPGKQADVVAFARDPTTDITDLTEVRLVLRDGVEFNPLASEHMFTSVRADA